MAHFTVLYELPPCQAPKVKCGFSRDTQSVHHDFLEQRMGKLQLFFFINRKGQTCLMYIHYKWIFLLVFQRAQGSLREKLDSKVLHTVGDHLFFHTAFTTQRHWMLKKSSYVEKTVFFIPNIFIYCSSKYLFPLLKSNLISER